MSLANLLIDGGIAIVVGVRSTNVAPEYREHPQLRFWDTTDPASYRRPLPSNTRALVFTRYLKHTLFNRLVAEAKARKITIIPGLQNTGQLRRTMDELLGRVTPEPSPVVETEVTAPEPVAEEVIPIMAEHTTVTSWIEQHADLSAKTMPESERLFALATKAGIKTTPLTVTYLLRKLRKARGLSPRQNKPLKAAALRASTSDTPAVASTPVNGSLVSLLDDTIAGLQLMRERISSMESEYTSLIGLRSLREKLRDVL